MYILEHNDRIRKRYILTYIADMDFTVFVNKLKFAKWAYIYEKWLVRRKQITKRAEQCRLQLKHNFCLQDEVIKVIKLCTKCSLPRLQSMDFPVQLRPSLCHVQLQQIYFLCSKCFESTLKVVIFHRFRR